MINVKFYSFSKKENSTKVPTSPVVPSAEYSCLLKDGSGVISPELEIATSANVSAWNYCYIPDFGRYYFVSEWTYDNGQWIAKLTIDVLASWRYEISQSNQYILRSSYEYDGYIDDAFYQGKTQSTITHTTLSGASLQTTMLAPEGPAIQNFMVGIINNDSTYAPGAVSYYTMGTTRIGRMKQALMTDNGWIGNVDSGSATSVQIAQSQVAINPYQYIASCRWFPVNVPHADTETTNIRCGWWQANFTGYRFTGATGNASRIWTCDVPPHPQASRGSYLNNKTFTSHILDIAGFHFDLDANMVAQGSKLEVELYVDFISGQGCVKVFGKQGDTRWLIAEQIQNISVSIPLAQISYSSEGLAGIPLVGQGWSIGYNIGQTIAAAFGVKNTTNAAAQLSNSIGAAAGFNKITSSFTAGSGGLAAITAHPVPLLTTVHQLIVDEDNASAGRPLCKNRTISVIPGFIICKHVELAIPATEQEITAIKNYMEGGFFYE